MTSPTKPWEVPPNFRLDTDIEKILNSSSIPIEAGGLPIRVNVSPHNSLRNSVPPAIPARPVFNRSGYSPNFPSFNRMYNSGMQRSMNGYGYGSYSNYGPSYGNYGGYGGYNGSMYPESRLVHMAEESSRPAFESIESLIRAFGSISFMLESTYDTIYNSFRAVLDVAENVGRMRSVFGQIFSTFGIIRAMQWIYRKALYLLGYTSHINEKLWSDAKNSPNISPSEADEISKKTSWGGLLLFSILMTGPYIIWKLLNSLNLKISTPNHNDWMKSPNPYYRGVGLFDFDATNEQELSFKSKQKLYFAPREFQTMGKNWLLAYSPSTKKYGYVPYNYIKITDACKAGKPLKSSNQPPPKESVTQPQNETVLKNIVNKIDETIQIPSTVPTIESLATSSNPICGEIEEIKLD